MEQFADGEEAWRRQPLAVLVSGGLDSAILLGNLCRSSQWVVPIYVRFGLLWESAEEAGLRSFLDTLRQPSLQPLKTFQQSVADVYGRHWSTDGRGVPDFTSPDEAVFLPGRNLLLIAQAAIWCSLNDIPTIAMAQLDANPFPDSEDQFFDSYHAAIALSVDRPARIVRPFRRISKAEVMKMGVDFALERTFSCIRPVGRLHCGRCNKCAERIRAFKCAGIPDRTEYACSRLRHRSDDGADLSRQSSAAVE